MCHRKNKSVTLFKEGEIKKYEFVTDGYLCEKSNSHYEDKSYWVDFTSVVADDIEAENITYTILLPNNIDIRNGQKIKPAEQIFVYRYKDDYFITQQKFDSKTLNSYVSQPDLLGIRFLLVLIGYASMVWGFILAYFIKQGVL